MMSIDTFNASLSSALPPGGMGLALQALWWARKGQWHQAHGCVQQCEGSPDCDLVHAYLHREEGDLGNARSWYGAAGRAMAEMPLAEEWTLLATELLARG